MDFADSTWGLATREVWKAAHQEYIAQSADRVKRTFGVMRSTVLGLVTASEETRWGHNDKANVAFYGRLGYFEEHHIVSVGASRQSGKTEVIVQLANPEDLIIAFNTNIADNIWRRLKERHGDVKVPEVATAREVNALTESKSGMFDERMNKAKLAERLNRSFARIWVDESNMVLHYSSLHWSDFRTWVLANHPSLLPTLIRIN